MGETKTPHILMRQPTQEDGRASPKRVVVDGKYELLERIGRGGMGEVWKARVLNAENAFVALKVFVPPKDPSVREYALMAFQRELRLLQQIKSKHIAEIRDSGDFGDRPYFVMKLLDGISLRQHLAIHQQVSWREAMTVVADVAEALVRVHELGYVHRDVKPSNIFLETSGTRPEVYLIDFGIAEPAGGHHDGGPRTAILGDSASVGTPEFCAPEQQAGGAVFASDLYALGVIAHRAITGNIPFDVGRHLQAHAHATQPPPPIEIPDVPEAVKALILRLLAKEPQDRPKSAALLAEEIRRLLATPDLATENSTAAARRRGQLRAGAAMLWVMVTVVVGGILLLRSTSTPIAASVPVDPALDGVAPPAEEGPPSGFVDISELGEDAVALYGLYAQGQFEALSVALDTHVKRAASPSLWAALAIAQANNSDCRGVVASVDAFETACDACGLAEEQQDRVRALRDDCMGFVRLAVTPPGARVLIRRTDPGAVDDRKFQSSDAPIALQLPLGQYVAIASKSGCGDARATFDVKDAADEVRIGLEVTCQRVPSVRPKVKPKVAPPPPPASDLPIGWQEVEFDEGAKK